ncbi:MAG TPA: lysophospholipid acyltransferase family protein [Holophagaceae bacterium]|nr:lysophospholipid acyltransferase family protein [Holophagaceae bacterium]
MANWRDNAVWGFVTMIWGLLTVPLVVVLILLGACVMGPHRSFWLFGPWWHRQFFAVCGIQRRITGWESLPEDIRAGRQPAVFMSNHQSQLDPPYLLGAIPVHAVYIAKRELKWVPFIGWAAAAAGAIFIDRSNRERAVASLHEAALKVRGGRNVVIFPEGTRTRTGELLPFKKGGFNLAMDANVPIIPIATLGGFRILPKGARRVKPGLYEVRFGAPVDPAAFSGRDALMEEVRNRIQSLMG